MRRLSIIGPVRIAALAVLATLAIGALAAGMAAAAPTLELFSIEGAIKPGDEVTLAVAETVTAETNEGNITCITSGAPESGTRLPGTDVSNNAKTDDVALGVQALFQTHVCDNGISLLGATANAEWFGLSSSLGTLSLSTAHKAEVSAPDGDVFFLQFSDGTGCEYRYTKLKAAFSAATNELQPAFIKQKLTEQSGSSSACPKSVTLTFTIELALTKTNSAVGYRING
jgi:hypothetical protein